MRKKEKLINRLTPRSILGSLKRRVISRPRNLFTTSTRKWIPSIRRQYKRDRLVGPVGYWKKLQKFQMNFLSEMGLKKHHELLDIACGPLQGGLAFIQYLDPGNYVGIDIREEPLQEGRKLISEGDLSHKKPVLYLSETFGKNELGNNQFDFIWCSQTLYIMSEEQVSSLFEQLSIRLRNNGVFYGDIIGYPNNVRPESRWRGFEFYLHKPERLIEIARENNLVIRQLGPIEKFGYPAGIDLRTNEMLEIRKSSVLESS